MNLTLTGSQYEIDAATRTMVEKKLSRLERYYDRITSAHVVLTLHKIIHRAEATVRISGNELYADATASDMQSAIDLLAKKLDRQIVKHKEKTTKRRVS